jgi:hypothetical protein
MACRTIESDGKTYTVHENPVMIYSHDDPGKISVLAREYVPVGGGDSVIVDVRADCSVIAIANSQAMTATLVNGQHKFQTHNAGQIANIIFAMAIDDVIALVDFARRGRWWILPGAALP